MLTLAMLTAALLPQEPPPWRADKLERSIVAPLEELWQVETGSTSFGAACCADFDGDGVADLAFGSYFGDSRLRVLRGKDGNLLWEHDFGGGEGKACLDVATRTFDLDGDGTLELVQAVSNEGALYAFDARSGKQRWRAELGAGTDSPPWLGDVDGDGALEIVIGAFDAALHFVDARSGKVTRRLAVAEGAVQTGPVALDVDGDGALDWLAGTFRGDNAFGAWSGSDGRELWRVSLPRGGQLDLGIYHGAAVGDLDGDGTVELVICGYDGVVRCLTPQGTERWRVQPGDRYFMAPAAIGDVDGDGRPEVIAVSHRATVIRGNGEVLYSVPLGAAAGPAADRGASLADLDGDGRLDIALLRADGWFGVLRGSTGELIHEYRPREATRRPAIGNAHGPAIADFDGDGRLDVFYVIGSPIEKQRFGVAVALTGFAGKGPGWTTLQHDAQNSGNAVGAPAAAAKAEPPGRFELFVLGRMQDGGLPHVGCDRDCCTAARREGRRETPACLGLLDRQDRKLVLVEATPGVEEQLTLLHRLSGVTGRGRQPVDHVLITHAHIGHYLGLAHFGREVASTSALPVHGTPKLCAFLREHAPWRQLVSLQQIGLVEHKAGQWAELLPGLQVRALVVPHRDEFSDTVAFQFKGARRCVLFVPDVDRWDAHPGLLDRLLEGVDVAYLDGTFYDGRELPGRDLAEVPHPPIVRTMELLAERARSKPGTLRFIHLNHDNPVLRDAALLQQLRERGFRIAEVGERIGL